LDGEILMLRYKPLDGESLSILLHVLATWGDSAVPPVIIISHHIQFTLIQWDFFVGYHADTNIYEYDMII